MSDILRIKRRPVGGAAGPPASLAAAEIAYNEQDDTLYYGKGNSAGAATSIIPIAGMGFKNIIPIADTPPASPANGSLWWESDTGTLWISYNDGTSTQWVAAAGGTTILAAGPGTPQGRLTIDGGAAPVLTTTVSAATTISYSPYVGNLVPIYNGTTWAMMPLAPSGGYIGIGIADTIRNPSPIGASKVNDWYVWDGGGGSLYLSHGPDWTDDLTRSAGTALVRVSGIWLNNVTIGDGTTTGPAAQRGTYVGTTRSNASSQLDWIYGTSAVGGGAAFLGVWNCYNRVNVATTVIEATTTWICNGLQRPFNGSTNNRVSAVFGLSEDEATAFAFSTVNVPSGLAVIGVGFNTTSALSGSWSSVSGSSAWVAGFGQHSSMPQGFNFWQWMESCSASASNSIAGIYPAVNSRSSLQFRARM